MRRTLLIGISAAVIGGIGIWIADALGITFAGTVLGVGGGVILAVVNDRSPLARLLGFFLGFVLGVFFTLMVAGLIPGGRTVAGIAIAFLVVMLPIALIAGLSSNRIPEWTMLLGVLMFTGNFTASALTAPWTAAEKLPNAFFTQLAMAAIGFLVVVVVQLFPEKDKGSEQDDPEQFDPEQDDPAAGAGEQVGEDATVAAGAGASPDESAASDQAHGGAR